MVFILLKFYWIICTVINVLQSFKSNEDESVYARHLKQTCFDYVKFNSEGKNAMYEKIGVSIITPAYNSDEFLPTTIAI